MRRLIAVGVGAGALVVALVALGLHQSGGEPTGQPGLRGSGWGGPKGPVQTATLPVRTEALRVQGAQTACVPRWRVVASGAQVPQLVDVAALSPTDVWAVGSAIVHWDGHQLRLDRTFSATGIAAVSSNDVWAVGPNHVRHWDGTGWRVVPTPRPVDMYKKRVAAAQRAYDHAAAAIARANAEAERLAASPPQEMRRDEWLKKFREAQSAFMDAAMARDLAKARLEAARRAQDTERTFSGIAAPSRNDVWVVGQVGTRPFSMHWNGRRWRMVHMHREGALYAVDGTSSANVWAVGAQGLYAPTINDTRGLVMHWNGRRWKEVEAVAVDDSDLGYEYSNDFSGIDAVSPTEAWATHNGVVSGDVQRWDGRSWMLHQTFPAKSILEDIAAVATNDVWAVGPTSNGREEEQHPLIAHWNGRSWRVQKTPFEGLRATLNGLSARSAKEIWAVGEHLIARYSC